MSGFGTMVLTLLLLVFMVTSHQDSGEKRATQRNGANVGWRRSIIRRAVDEECKEYCEQRNKNCCGETNGEPVCAQACLG
nr:TPA_inf: conotoxin precursor O3 [Conus judaeus]